MASLNRTGGWEENYQIYIFTGGVRAAGLCFFGDRSRVIVVESDQNGLGDIICISDLWVCFLGGYDSLAVYFAKHKI